MSKHYQDDETRIWHKATWRSFYCVLVLTSLIRCAFLVATQANLEQDPDAYRKLARTMQDTGVYGWRAESLTAEPQSERVQPTAFRPPLYPLVLAGIGGVDSIWPIGVLHLVLGVATAGLVACLGWRGGLGRWAFAAALLVAVDPILLQQSTLVMTETLAAFLAALAIVCLTPQAASSASSVPPIWKSAGAGLVLGLCVLCRPTFLPWLGLIALTGLSARANRLAGGGAATGGSSARAGDKRPISGRLVRVGVLVGAALLIIAPWVIRNKLVLGKAKLTTTHGGYTVLLGNNPLFYRFLQSGSTGTWDGEQLSRAWRGRTLTTGAEDDHWNDLPQLARLAEQHPTRATNELGDDDLAYQLAKRYIREQPGMFLYASGVRITRLWRLVPHRLSAAESTVRRTLRYLVGLWYAMVMGLAVVGLASQGRKIVAAPWLVGLQLCFVFTAVHTLYWSDMRMRAPLMPLVCLAAASGMAAIGGRLRRRKI